MTVNELDAPDYARPAIRRINETLAELRTSRIRFANAGAEVRPRERPDLAAMARDVATAPDAPPELARVARAVAEGRTTWEAIASGAAADLPEMVALRERAEEIRELLANGQVELEDVMWKRAPAPGDTPVAAVAVEVDDEPRDSFMVRATDVTSPGDRMPTPPAATVVDEQAAPAEPPTTAHVEEDDEPRDSFMVRGTDSTPPPGVRQTWRRRY